MLFPGCGTIKTCPDDLGTDAFSVSGTLLIVFHWRHLTRTGVLKGFEDKSPTILTQIR